MFANQRFRSLFTTALLFAGSSALATPGRWDSQCAGCHSNDSPTCDGCHEHGNRNLQANAAQGSYAPGELIEITLSGGTRGGWVRSILYDDSNLEVDRTEGPSGTGDNGGFPLELPATLYTEAPAMPGSYTLDAAYYGNSNGNGHNEVRRPVTIMVAGDASPAQVELLPDALPIFIDPIGGSFGYEGTVRNDGASAVTIEVEAEVVLPSGGLYGPVLGPLTLTLPAGAAGSMHVDHDVPAVAPTGLYLYRAIVSIDGVEADRAVFRFVKE
jgi:hypothetical protein